MRDKVGCRDDFDQNLQNFSESFGNSNMIRNTISVSDTQNILTIFLSKKAVYDSVDDPLMFSHSISYYISITK